MPLDYTALSNKYKPVVVNTLLVGDTPAPGGATYFYLPRTLIKESGITAAIFRHYFGTIPVSVNEYEFMLNQLKKHKIFLIDICDIPLRIANRVYKDGINPEQLEILKSHIPHLRSKILARNIVIPDENITFLLPYPKIFKQLRKTFPGSKYILLKDFRESRELL